MNLAGTCGERPCRVVAIFPKTAQRPSVTNFDYFNPSDADRAAVVWPDGSVAIVHLWQVRIEYAAQSAEGGARE